MHGNDAKRDDCGQCGLNTRPPDYMMKYDFSLALSQLSYVRCIDETVLSLSHNVRPLIDS